MTEVEQFIARARSYCERTGTQQSTLSRKLLGNGNRLAELATGKSFPRVDTFSRAKNLLSEMEKAIPTGRQTA